MYLDLATVDQSNAERFESSLREALSALESKCVTGDSA